MVCAFLAVAQLFVGVFLSNGAKLFQLRLPYTDICVHRSFGSSLRDVSALKLELLANPPRTGFHTADGIQFCTVVFSRHVLVRVWTYPRMEMEIEKTSGRAPEISGVSTKVTKYGIVFLL